MPLIEKLRNLYLNNLKNNKPYIEEYQWKNLKSSFSLNHNDFLLKAVEFAKDFSRSPISNYKVGAIGITKSNRLFIGTNIEFPHFSLNQSIHAEQAVVSMAYANNELGFNEICISEVPCGHCRQFLREMYNYNSVSFYIKSHSTSVMQLAELLPHSFGPENLNINEALFRKNIKCTNYKFTENKTIIPDDDKNHIINSVQKSFSPYSNSPSGIVFIFENGTPILGSVIESCAYNPTLSAFQMAFVQFIFQKRNPKDIKTVYATRIKNQKVNHESSSKSLIKELFGQAKYIQVDLE